MTNLFGTKSLCVFITCILSLINMGFRDIPYEHWNDFTRSGQIPFEYLGDNKTDGVAHYKYYDAKRYIQKTQVGLPVKNGKTDRFLYELLEENSSRFEGKKVAIVCSSPIEYQGVTLAYKGNPTLVIRGNDNFSYSENYLTLQECTDSGEKFDYIISIDFIADHGMGKYGEEISANADIDFMKFFRHILKKDGQLIISIPVGKEKILWNKGRIYGEKRLKILLEGWKIVKYYGFKSQDLHYGIDHQPVFLLKKK